MDETPEQVKCPHCNRLTAPGRFCQACGKRLAAPPVPPPATASEAAAAAEGERGNTAEVARPIQPLPGADPRMGTPSVRADIPGGEPPSLPRGPLRAPAPQVAAPDVPDAAPVRATYAPLPGGSEGECPIEVEYNFARAFVVGHTYPFQFRIRAPRAKIKALRLRFSGDIGGNAIPPPVTVPYQIGPNFSPIPVNFTPLAETFGEPAFTITFDCQCAHSDAWHSYIAIVSHRIYPEHVQADEAAKSLVVNIRNNIQNQGHAVDIRTNAALDEISRFAGPALGGDRTREMYALIDRIAGAPIYSPLQLIPVVEEGRRRLTLVRGDTEVHLIDGASVSFGRRKHNDITLRVFDNAGGEDQNLSAFLSRNHFRIDFDGHTCVLRDGGRDPDAPAFERSSHGTALNGVLMPPKGRAPIPYGQPSTIALAAKLYPEGVLAFTVTPNPCLKTATSRPCPAGSPCALGVTASLTLRRGDTIPEAYLLVWRCADLSPFFPDLAAAVYRMDDRFVLCRADGAVKPLTPGTVLRAPDGPIAVQDFHQIGL